MIILIKETNTKKYYQLDFNIFNHYGPGKTIEALWEADPIKLVKGYAIDEDISVSVNKICVSDATTHIERLVFPAFWVKNISTGERHICCSHNNIDGKHTYCIHGGDSATVHSHKVYIRHLRMINK